MHLRHLEDLSFSPELINSLVELQIGSATNIELRYKIDGAPAIVFGVDDIGCFVSRKHEWQKNRYRSESELKQSTMAPSVADLMYLALTAIRRVADVKMLGVYQGDCLQRVANGMYRSNILSYDLDCDESLAICVHSTLEGLDFWTERTDLKLGVPGVVHLFNNIVDPTPIAKCLNYNLIQYQCDLPKQFMELSTRIINYRIKHGASELTPTLGEFNDVANSLYGPPTDRNIRGRYLKWINDNADVVEMMLTNHRELSNTKSHMLNLLAKSAPYRSYVDEKGTQLEMDEGYVLSYNSELVVKLIDRSKFTVYNFRAHGDMHHAR